MFDIFFIVSLFIFSVACFFEIVVFNEEILLALCFFSFIFFSFNSMGNSIYESFHSRAAKFEEDLLVSFSLTKNALGTKFENFVSSRGFVSKFKILSLCINNYLSVFTTVSSYKWFSLFLVSSFAKLSELSVFENKLISAFQEKCVSLLLYPLIFQTSSNNLAFLASNPQTLEVGSKNIVFLSALSKSY